MSTVPSNSIFAKPSNNEVHDSSPSIQLPQLCSTIAEADAAPALVSSKDCEVSPRAPLMAELGKRGSLFESFDASRMGVGVRSSDDSLVEGNAYFELLKTDTTGNILPDGANMLRVSGRINSIVSKVNRVLQKQGGVGNPYATATPASTPRSNRLQPINIPGNSSKNMLCRKSSFTDDDIAGLYTSTTPTHASSANLAASLPYSRVSNSNMNNWMQPDESSSHINRSASSYLHSKSEADGELSKPRVSLADARICSPSMWALSLSQGVSKSSSGSAASSPSAVRRSNELNSPGGQAVEALRAGREAVGLAGAGAVGVGCVRLRSMQARHAIQIATATQTTTPTSPAYNRDKRRFST